MKKPFKYVILLIMVAFLVGIWLPQGVNADVISQIGNKDKSKLVSLDELKQNSKLMPDTILADNNKAYVETVERKVEIDKFEATNSEKITLKLTSESKVSSLCFFFPVDTKYIEIKNIKVNVPFWFDDDLKSKEHKKTNKICYSGLEINTEDIYYEIEYKPVQGLPLRIKYDIDADGLILDPYLIGNLATSLQLILRLPFDNNSSNVFSSQLNSFPVTALQYVNIPTVYSYTGSWITPENAADNNYGTYSSYTASGGQNYIYYFEFEKNASQTAAIWQTKTYLKNTSALWINDTIPNNCFNAYTDKIQVKYHMYFYSMSPLQYFFYTYCDTGNGLYTQGMTYKEYFEFSEPKGLYDSSMIYTNQSNYSVYSYPEIKTQYVNDYGLVWANFFHLYGNDTTGLKNWVNVSQIGVARNITYSTEGAVFNGQNSTITLS